MIQIIERYVTKINKTDFPYKGKYYTKSVSVGEFISTLEPTGDSSLYNSIALFIQSGGVFECNANKFPTDFPYAIVIDANTLQVSQLISDEENISFEADKDFIVCLSTMFDNIDITVRTPTKLQMLAADYLYLKKTTNEALAEINLKVTYSEFISSELDVVSDKWVKGNSFIIECDNPSLRELYGMYGADTSDGYDRLDYNLASTKGIELERDYYAIRLYNSKGINKKFKVFKTPNLPQLSEKVENLSNEFEAKKIFSPSDFGLQGYYIATKNVQVGDYIPNLIEKLIEFSTTSVIVLPLNKGKSIEVKNLKTLGDIPNLIVLDVDTRICTKVVNIDNQPSFSYTATENSIVFFSTSSAEAIVTCDDDFRDYTISTSRNLKINSFSYNNANSFYRYEAALKMDKAYLKSIVETASNGKCTVIYDNNNYPSLMYRIPIVSIGALNSKLGDNNTPHPAFVVNGVTKKYIYAGVFMNSDYKGVPVSWFGLSANGKGSYVDVKNACANKGAGWHMETIWERSLISLLSAKYHNNEPRGNVNKGQAKDGYEYECVQLVNGGIPGQVTHSTSWINGTEPNTWSHDNSNWGIFDIIGGYHERCDLLKVVNGKVFLAADNSFGSDELTWMDTGVYLTYQDEKITIDANDAPHVGELKAEAWNNIVVKEGYNTIGEDIRKKICLALIHPYLSSSLDKVFEFDGNLWIKDDITAYPFLGGAAGYIGSSLGFNIISYDNQEDHGNIGARLFFVE